MTAGRCPGCGYTNMSCKKVTEHMMSCEEAAAAYKADPTRSMDPEEEYDRYLEEEVAPAREAKIQGYEQRRVDAKAASKIALAEMDAITAARQERMG